MTERGIHCNDRKFETWTLSAFAECPADNSGFVVPGNKYVVNRRVQVYAVPKGGNRGAETDHFKIVIDGIAITSDNLKDLRKKAQDVYTGLTESDYEKVLVVKTRGRSSFREGQEQGDEFGLEWLIGWRSSKLGCVLSESRGWVLDTENYDEPEEDTSVTGFKIGVPGQRGKQEHKTAVLTWTQEREDVLRKAVAEIGLMRERLNDTLLQPEQFANLLDSKAGALLLPEASK